MPEPPTPDPEMHAYVRCENIAALRSVPQIAAALARTSGVAIPLTAPEIDENRPVILAYRRHRTEVWLPVLAPLPGWPTMDGWAVANRRSKLDDFDTLGAMPPLERDGCVLHSVVRGGPFSRTAAVIRVPKDDDQTTFWLDQSNPLVPERRRRGSGFAVAIHGGRYQAAEVPLWESMAKLGRPPLFTPPRLAAPDGPRLVMVPFARPWSDADLDAAAAALGGERDGPWTRLGDVWIARSGRHLLLSPDRPFLEEVVQAGGSRRLEATLSEIEARRDMLASVTWPDPTVSWAWTRAPRDDVYAGGPPTSGVPVVLDPNLPLLHEPWSRLLPDQRGMVLGETSRAVEVEVRGSVPAVAGRFDRALVQNGLHPVTPLRIEAESAHSSFETEEGSITLDVEAAGEFVRVTVRILEPHHPAADIAMGSMATLDVPISDVWERFRLPVTDEMTVIQSDPPTLMLRVPGPEPCASILADLSRDGWAESTWDGDGDHRLVRDDLRLRVVCPGRDTVIFDQ